MMHRSTTEFIQILLFTPPPRGRGNFLSWRIVHKNIFIVVDTERFSEGQHFWRKFIFLVKRDDLHFPYEKTENIKLFMDVLYYCRAEYLAKIRKRVKQYEIKILNPPRLGKKLLVLDVDFTLFGK